MELQDVSDKMDIVRSIFARQNCMSCMYCKTILYNGQLLYSSLQVKHSTAQLKSIRNQADGINGGIGGDGSVIQALGLVRRPNDAVVGGSDESKKGKRNKCVSAKTKSGMRDSRKTDKNADESKDPTSDTRDARKAKKDARSEPRNSKVSNDAKGSGQIKSKKSRNDPKESAAGMTRFGPADAEFVFKLERCKLFSFSKVNKKDRVKKGDLNQRLFGNSPDKKRRK